MTHIAIQEKLDGKVVDWMEQVSDEQYPEVIARTSRYLSFECISLSSIADISASSVW